MKLFLIVAAAATAAALFPIVDCQLSNEYEALVQKWKLFTDILSPSMKLVVEVKNVINGIDDVSNTFRPNSSYTFKPNAFSMFLRQNQREIELNILKKYQIPSSKNGSEYEPPDYSDDFELNPECYNPAVEHFFYKHGSWARAPLVAAAYSLCRNNNNTYIHLDARQIVYCSRNITRDSPLSAFDEREWHGAVMANMARNGGLVDKSFYKKASSDRECPKEKDPKFVAKITEFSDFIPMSRELGVLERIVSKDNVVSAAMAVYDTFFYHSSGIYDDTDCNGKDVNHAVAIVGYGKDKTSGVLFWTIVNKWNYVNTLEENYTVQIERGRNLCSIETYAYTIKAVPVIPKKN